MSAMAMMLHVGSGTTITKLSTYGYRVGHGIDDAIVVVFYDDLITPLVGEV